MIDLKLLSSVYSPFYFKSQREHNNNQKLIPQFIFVKLVNIFSSAGSLPNYIGQIFYTNYLEQKCRKVEVIYKPRGFKDTSNYKINL